MSVASVPSRAFASMFSGADRRLAELTHHLVNLLKRQAPRLGNEEVRPEDAAGAQPAPDEEDFGAKVTVGWVDHVGDDDAW